MMVSPRLILCLMLLAHFYLNRTFLRNLGENEPSKKKIMCLTLWKPL